MVAAQKRDVGLRPVAALGLGARERASRPGAVSGHPGGREDGQAGRRNGERDRAARPRVDDAATEREQRPAEAREEVGGADETTALGRLATQIADVLRGKRKPTYTPHVDVGDFVVVINAEKIKVTGKKLEDKRYWRHSGYPGGIRSRTLGELLEQRPEEVIRKAVKGMLPRNRLARQQLRKLKVYAGPEHPHQAQQPKTLEIET